MAIYIPFGDSSYRVKPGIVSVQNWFSGKFSIHADSHGMRCGRNGQRCLNTEDPMDLLVFGDSQAFGLGVQYMDSIVGVMSQEAIQEKTVVANASVGGHFLLNQLELAKSLDTNLTRRLESTVILLTPRTIANPQGYSRAHVANDGQLFGTQPTLLTHVRTWLRTHTTIYVMLRNTIRTMFNRAKSSESIISIYENLSAKDERLEQLHTILSEFKIWANERNSKLVLAYLPLLLEFEFDHIFSPDQQDHGKYSKDAPSTIAAQAAKQLGVEYIDTREVLGALASRKIKIQLTGDSHYNETASWFVGKNIWQNLSKRK